MESNNKTLNTNYNFLIHILIAALFIVLIGCSGGGGSSGGSPQSPNPSTPSNPTPSDPAPSPNPDPDPAPSQSFDELVSLYESNDEYQDQWGLAAINASSAYARGATGKGIVIGLQILALIHLMMKYPTQEFFQKAILPIVIMIQLPHNNDMEQW